jgi:CRISPR-associated protein Cas1
MTITISSHSAGSTVTGFPAPPSVDAARLDPVEAPPEDVPRDPLQRDDGDRPRRARPIDARGAGDSGEPPVRFLHVVEQGTMVRRAGSRVVVTKKDAVLLDVPAMKMQGVLVYGNVQVSTQCLRNLLEEGVWVSFFSRNGTYRGRLQPPSERGGALRRRQWQRSADEAFCLQFAKAVVRGKILSQKRVAAAYAKNYLAETLGSGHEILRESLDRVEDASDVAQLRGIEGNATRAYFDLFRRWNRSSLPFDGRVKHPPTGPVNSLLSFGYVLLTREVEGLLEAAGLDPCVGFYHGPDNDRPSLACDWVEEFRHDGIDRLVLSLLNLGTIKAADFEEPGEKRGVRLKPDALRKFLTAYERALTGRFPEVEPGTGSCGVRAVLLDQLGLLLDALSGRDMYRTHLELDIERADCSRGEAR